MTRLGLTLFELFAAIVVILIFLGLCKLVSVLLGLHFFITILFGLVGLSSLLSISMFIGDKMRTKPAGYNRDSQAE